MIRRRRLRSSSTSRSAARRAVMLRMMPVKNRCPSRPRHSAIESSSGKSEPSLRHPWTSRPMPMIRRIPDPQIIADIAVVTFAMFIACQHGHVPADQFRFRIAEGLGGGRIDGLDDALVVDHHHGIDRRFENRPMLAFAGLQGALARVQRRGHGVEIIRQGRELASTGRDVRTGGQITGAQAGRHIGKFDRRPTDIAIPQPDYRDGRTGSESEHYQQAQDCGPSLSDEGQSSYRWSER